MAEMIFKAEGIETAGALKALLDEYPDDTPVSDAFGGPLNLRKIKSNDVSEGGKYPPLIYVEIY